MSHHVDLLQIVPYVGIQHTTDNEPQRRLLDLPDVCLRNICDRLTLRDFVCLVSTCKDARCLIDLFNDRIRFFLATLLNVELKPKEIIISPLSPIETSRNLHGKILIKTVKGDLATASLPSSFNIVESFPSVTNFFKWSRFRDVLIESLFNRNYDLADCALEFFENYPVLRNGIMLWELKKTFSKLIEEDNFQSCQYLLRNFTFFSNQWIDFLKISSNNLPIRQLLIQHPPVNDELLHKLLTSRVDFYQSFKELIEYPERITTKMKDSLYLCFKASVLMKHSDVFDRPEELFRTEELERFLKEQDGVRHFIDALDVKGLSDDAARYYLHLCCFRVVSDEQLGVINLSELKDKILANIKISADNKRWLSKYL
jgi:hypothetical protein